MEENYKKLNKYVKMIADTKSDLEALDIMVKIVLDASFDRELQEEALDYVNNHFEEASIEDSSYYA